MIFTAITIFLVIGPPILCLLLLWKVDTRLDVLEMWIKTVHEEVQKLQGEVAALGENTKAKNEDE